ncbi:MAG TPA: C13 family peptidase, partial [Gammaproteobacteria bacterium]
PEKDSYRGDFVKGKFTGTGSYEDAAGNRYEGGFRNWIFHGAGVYTSAAGGRYSGQFIDGAPVKGVFQSSEGEKYEGGFNNWLYEGTGVYIDAEGNRYSGEFVSGYYHGKGELVYAKPAADGAEKLSGEWQFGQFQDPAEAAKGATFEQAVEQALYQQNELLERNWRELISGAPAAIDLYFVGVAGYGEQDVFLKEVRFIRELFDRQFGTVGRSLLLVNNPQTMAEIPLATRTGLERTLHAVAAKMDPQQDILFLYLTSHGSATHELSINQNGIVLPDLSAEQLGEILDKLPVRWKVVIVSACYSGGFIPYLENEHTLVMTAASANRKSFGCSDTSEMTYFGKAYFKEALPQAQSFQQAFVSAKQLIQEWEQEEIKTNGGKHSKPQIAAGTAILLYLEQWWRQRRQAASAEKTIAR